MRRRALLGGAVGLAAPGLAVPGLAVPGLALGRLPRDIMRPPRLRAINLPAFPGAHAIWGATGADQRGGIWAGVSAFGGGNSAHLIEFDSTISRVFDRGDVLTELARFGPRPDGESQSKLHSKMVQADDGWLYFVSTDEAGESNTAPPRWGSHLWRLRPGIGRWEHVLAVPEGLIALAGAGRWVWALGLWDHVLYCHDTRTRQTNRVVVGAIAGHMSRNFVVDGAGHAYVPRVTLAGDRLMASLIAFTPSLDIVGETPLEHYADTANPVAAHGITAFVALADGSQVIATSFGHLYRITPRQYGAASVLPLGWFHPDGAAYVPSLFTWDGVRHIVGLARDAEMDWQWVVYDLTTRRGTAQPFPHGETEKPLLLYGSMTTDRQGRFYIGGRRRQGDQRFPILLQLDTL